MKDELNYELLADVAQVIMGQSPPSSTYNTVGKGLPFYQGKTDFGDMYPTPRVYCTEPSRIAEAGDILISVLAPVGPTNVSQERSCIGRGISAIRVGEKLDRDFLLYFLRFYEPELAKAGTGSTFTAIACEDLETIKLPLPPLTEQKRIASLLARADRLRQLRRTAHDLGDALLQSVFLEMFGNVVRNEKGWEKAAISDLGKVQTGNTPSREEPKNFGDFIEWIKSDNIRDEQLYVSPSREKLSELGLKKGRTVDAGAVLITCIAGSLEHIGDTSLTDRTVAFNQQINAVSPFDDMNPLFLRTMLHIAKPYVQNNASAGMKHIITKSKLEELVLVKPPLNLQEEFASVVARVESLRGRMGESQRQVEGLFESLLSGSFSS
jgi:type I restriction enzyme S subunit